MVIVWTMVVPQAERLLIHLAAKERFGVFWGIPQRERLMVVIQGWVHNDQLLLDRPEILPLMVMLRRCGSSLSREVVVVVLLCRGCFDDEGIAKILLES